MAIRSTVPEEDLADFSTARRWRFVLCCVVREVLHEDHHEEPISVIWHNARLEVNGGWIVGDLLNVAVSHLRTNYRLALFDKLDTAYQA